MMLSRFGGKFAPGEHVPHKSRCTMFINIAVDPIVDRQSGRLVAATETGHVTHRHVFRAASPESLVQATFKLGSAPQMARHIGADADFRLSRRREMKVWIKTGYRMNLAERHLNPGGEFLQQIGGQIAELMLNGPEFVDQATGSLSTGRQGYQESIDFVRQSGYKARPLPQKMCAESWLRIGRTMAAGMVDKGRVAWRLGACLTIACIGSASAQNTVV